MKKTFILFVFFLCALEGYNQQDTLTPKIEKIIEEWCPIYVINNYCSHTGLTNIYRKFKVDDRVSRFTKVANIYEPSQDSMTVVKYNNVSILFENWQDVEYLQTFILYFEEKEDLEMFTICYSYLMGFMKDEKDPKRFYYKNEPMNAVTQSSFPEKKLYFATCFVYQPGFCGD